MTTESRTIAVLIDADNAQAPLIAHILDEASQYGDTRVRRIYGDWTSQSMSSWRGSLNAHAIQPVQQFSYIKGKNATDIALVIDAMDLLHSGTVQGFCIVSSDSDYTRLATRVREQGLFVMGIGRENTPEPFQAACDTFVFVESLAPQLMQPPSTQESPAHEWISIVTRAIESSKKVDGWTRLAEVGTHLKRQEPDFSCKALGFKQLGLLLESAPTVFDLHGQGTQRAVRLKG